jgi:arsenate reductase (glutaredoxin)
VTVMIWHNPRCGKSRLKLIEARNILPVIRLYLTDPPTPDEIRAARDLLGVPAVGMMRTKETAFREAALSKDMDDDAAMAAQPILIERPIVLANGKAALGRPPEAVLAIL